jgi:dTDP-4-dehydrorhamnose reductase
MKILITGGSGALGRELCKVFPNAYAPSHSKMDTSNKTQVWTAFMRYKPDVVIHTAAIIDARKCEDNWKHAADVNILGTHNVAFVADRSEAKMIHISTACVFDGEGAPFDEDSRPSPKNWYAMTKFSAEYIVMSTCSNYLLIRTNFAPKGTWKYPAAFTDRFGSYLFAPDVAHAIKDVMDMNGIVHVCGDTKLSMFDLAKLTTPDIKPTTLADYTGAPLCRDMTLVSKRIAPFKIGVY